VLKDNIAMKIMDTLIEKNMDIREKAYEIAQKF